MKLLSAIIKPETGKLYLNFGSKCKVLSRILRKWTLKVKKKKKYRKFFWKLVIFLFFLTQEKTKDDEYQMLRHKKNEISPLL